MSAVIEVNVVTRILERGRSETITLIFFQSHWTPATVLEVKQKIKVCIFYPLI